METTTSGSDNLLPRREVIYCGECGLPPEYCEFLDPKFVATRCDPWLRSNHPDLYEELAPQRSANKAATTPSSQSPAEGKGSAGHAKKKSAPKPDKPWTTEERLTEFYRKYVPEKMSDVPSLLEKYSGKEDKLFTALTKKYGPEPLDPYYSDSEDDSESDADQDNEDGGDKDGPGDGAAEAAAAPATKTRKVAGPKKTKQDADGGGGALATRVTIRKVAQKKKRNLTVVSGMETIPGVKLKDASKAFSKRFAGSSSVKDNIERGGQDIILQGDHMYDVAEMIVDKFGVPDTCLWLDIDGDVVPLR
jgi:density-regulated protein